jgi:hypothetical protein
LRINRFKHEQRRVAAPTESDICSALHLAGKKEGWTESEVLNKRIAKESVGQENQSQIGTVFLHGTSESCLCISCEVISFVDHKYHLEITPADVGTYDRVVVQELLKEVAQTQQVDLKCWRCCWPEESIADWDCISPWYV